MTVLCYNSISYLGCDLTCEGDKDLAIKINRFQNICGTISRTVRRKDRKKMQIKLYKITPMPTLLYEMLGTKTEGLRTFQTTEIIFPRAIQGCSRLDTVYNLSLIHI